MGRFVALVDYWCYRSCLGLWMEKYVSEREEENRGRQMGDLWRRKKSPYSEEIPNEEYPLL